MLKKTSLVFVMFAMLFNSIGLQAMAPEPIQNENKEELNMSGVVDEIDISPNVLRHGELAKITINFSEKPENKLTKNSIVTMDFPQDLSIFSQSKDDPIELLYGNKIIGIVYTIPGNQLVMEFNENVENSYDHKGSFYVTAKASYPADGTEEVNVENRKDYLTQMGTNAPSADYAITYYRTEGKSPFFYKPGGAIWTSDPQHINWWLHINRNQDPFLSDIEITDKLHSGQEFVLIDRTLPVTIGNLDPDAFKITLNNLAGEVETKVLSPQTFVEQGYGSFEFLSNEEFVININKEASLPSVEYTILYKTKITSEGKYQSYFYNDAVGKYVENGENVVKEQLNREAQNISSGGTITPEKGALRIIKLAKDGEVNALLPGATFKIFNEDGSEVDYLSETVFETDATGGVSTPALNQGKYYITELTAPNFVDFDPTIKYPFEVRLDSSVGVELVITNEVKRIDIPVEKIWNDDLDEHPEISIQLLANGEKVDEVLLQNGTTKHVFSDLPEYTVDGELIDYSVAEAEVPGYEQEIIGDAQEGFTITNTPIRILGKLEAEKNVSQDEVRVGEPFTYTITVRNTEVGSESLKDIVVKDTLPKGVTFTDKKIYVNGVLVEATITDDMFELILPEVPYGEDILVTFGAVATEDVYEHANGSNKNVSLKHGVQTSRHQIPTQSIDVDNIKWLPSSRENRFGGANDFNAILFEKFTDFNETGGPVASKMFKDVGTVGFEAGQAPAANQFTDITIPKFNVAVLANDVSFTNTHSRLNVRNGQIVVPAGTVKDFVYREEKITEVAEDEIHAFFTEAKNDMTNLNKELWAQTNTASFERVADQLILNLEPGVNIVELSDGLAMPSTLVFNYDQTKETPTLIIKVGNSSINKLNLKNIRSTFINNNQLHRELDPLISNMLWVFEPTINEITFNNSEVLGSVLAPNADIIFDNGTSSINGVLIANSLRATKEAKGSELHFTGGFLGALPQNPKPEDKEKPDLPAITVINKAEVTNPEDPENPEEPEVPVTVVPDGKIVAFKDVSKATVKPGETFTYTITVSNVAKDSQPVKQVVVQDKLPDGIAFTTGEVFVDGVKVEANIADNMLELILPEVRYGEEIAITFEVRADGTTTGTVINKATVINPEDPENPEEPEVPVVITPLGKLTAEKLASSSEVRPGELFEYTIVVKNTVEGSTPLTNVVVQDTLPEGIIFEDGIIYVDGEEVAATVQNNQFELTLPTVAFGADVRVSFTVKALEDVFGTKINKATVTNPEDPENPEEPEVPVIVTPLGKLEAEKLVSKPEVRPEEAFTYTIVVKNTKEGSQPLVDVEVQDTLPEGIKFVTGDIYIDGEKANVTVDGNAFKVVIPQVSYGAEVHVTFEVMASSATFGTRVNKAVVTNPEDPEEPEEPEVPVIVTPLGKLEAEKLISKNNVRPNEAFTYTIVVRNIVEGSEPLKNIIVEDALPEGITFTTGEIFVDGKNTGAIIENNRFEVTLAEVNFGTDIKITFQAKASEDTAGLYVNKATVTNPEDPENPEEPEIPVTVTPLGKLAAEKLVNHENVKPGEPFMYTILVKNIKEGSDPLLNVAVQDTLPEGIRFLDEIVYVDDVIVDAQVSGNQFEVIIPTVEYGKDIAVTFEAIAEENTVGKKINKATVTNPEDPENPEEPEVPVVVIPHGKIAAIKEVSQAIVRPGEVFTYTITVSNTVENSDPVQNVRISDTLPKGIQFADGIIYVNGLELGQIATNQAFDIIFDEVAYGKDVKISFDVFAEDAVFGTRINKAKVVDPLDPEPKEPEVPVEVIPLGEISADKKVNKTTVRPGEPFTYTIVVNNIVQGSQPLKDVIVEDVLPEGIVFTDEKVYVNNIEVPANIADNKLQITLAEVAYSEAVEVSFSVYALEDTVGEKINIAKITNPEDPENPEEPEVPITVVPLGKLYAEKQTSHQAVEPDEIFTYTIVVRNTEFGSSPLKDVVVEDTLPEGVEFVDGTIYVDGVAQSVLANNRHFSLTVPTVKYGTDVKVSFDVYALEGYAGDAVNIAKVTNPEDPENPEEPEIPVKILEPELRIAKFVQDANNDEVVEENEVFTYEVVIENVGNGDARANYIQDKMEKVLPYIHEADKLETVAVTIEGGENLSIERTSMTLSNLVSGFHIDILAGKKITISFAVTLVNDVKIADLPTNNAGQPILPNIVSLNSDYTPEDPKWKKPQEAEVIIPVVKPVLRGFKTVEDANGDDIVQSGERLTYTLRAENIGTGFARNILIQDKMEQVLPYVVDREATRNMPVMIEGLEKIGVTEIFVKDLIQGVRLDIAPNTEVSFTFTIVLSDKINMDHLPKDYKGRPIVLNKALIGPTEPEVEIPVEEPKAPTLPVTGEKVRESIALSLIGMFASFILLYFGLKKNKTN